MAKFHFETKEEQAAAIERAKSLKPNVDNVYANEHGYVVDGFRGSQEVLVSFKNLHTLLALEDSFKKETTDSEPTPEPVKEEVANDVSDASIDEVEADKTETTTRTRRKKSAE